MSKDILLEAAASFSELDPAIKAYLKDLLIAGGLVPSSKATRSLPNQNESRWNYFYDAANAICDELRNGYFDFNAVDSAINNLAMHDEMPIDPTTTYDEVRRYYRYNKKVRAPQLADAIAAFATAMKVYWDDIVSDPRKQAIIDSAKVNTLFGKAVNKYKRYKSQVDKQAAATARAAAKAAKAAAQPAINTTAANTGSQATVAQAQPQAAGNGAKKDDYKYLGPLSSQVRDLKGTPGNKIHLNSPVFIITGQNTNSTRVTPYAYVANLIPLPSGRVAGNAGNTNKVYFGSANGYRQYPLCFDNQQNADAFLLDVQNNITIPANMINLHVARVRADQNGYFMIGTEFGDAYVRASELNEGLQEEIKDDADEKRAKYSATRKAFKKAHKDELGLLPDSVLEGFND